MTTNEEIYTGPLVEPVRYTELNKFVTAPEILGMDLGPDELLPLFKIPTWPTTKPEFIVCLGRGIHGGEMTPAQFANVQLTMDIVEGEKVPNILYTGGWSENRDKPGKFSEAQKMMEYALKERSWPLVNVVGPYFIDTLAMDTLSSLIEMHRYMKDTGRPINTCVVADFTHAPRVKALIAKMGLSDQVEVVASIWKDNETEKATEYLKWEAAAFVSLLFPDAIVKKLKKRALNKKDNH